MHTLLSIFLSRAILIQEILPVLFVQEVLHETLTTHLSCLSLLRGLQQTQQPL